MLKRSARVGVFCLLALLLWFAWAPLPVWALPDAEVQKLVASDPEFALAEAELLKLWDGLPPASKKELKAEQSKWINTGRDKEAMALIVKNVKFSKAYTVVTWRRTAALSKSIILAAINSDAEAKAGFKLVVQDKEGEAKPFLLKAAERGNIGAQNMLAMICLKHAEFGSPEWEQGGTWIENVLKAAPYDGSTHLFKAFYYDGKKDKKNAEAWLLSAELLGNPLKPNSPLSESIFNDGAIPVTAPGYASPEWLAAKWSQAGQPTPCQVPSDWNQKVVLLESFMEELNPEGAQKD